MLSCASTANQNRGLCSTSQSELVTQTGNPDKVSDRRVHANWAVSPRWPELTEVNCFKNKFLEAVTELSRSVGRLIN